MGTEADRAMQHWIALVRSLLESLPSPPRRDGEGAAPCMDGLRRGASVAAKVEGPWRHRRDHQETTKSSTLRSVSLLGRAQHRCPVWLTLFEDVDAGMIIDCSPGSGTAARAALLANIPSYVGLARNEHHASFLCNVADRQALMMMQTAGSPLHHQDMIECISAHFSSLQIASIQFKDDAKDTEPKGEVTLHRICELTGQLNHLIQMVVI